ncbi:MAG: metal ABC transporter ATP-binding protein [Thiomicrospira sp.]|jgi:manganese/zinc/iron transport system ATP- binding protein|nr:metal ABC transporter ATP-binding protein [Thiomicrospira sp.]
MNAISVQALSMAYQDKSILHNLNFVLPAGKRIAIIGPNGAGKSSLLKALLKLVTQVKGEVLFFDQPLESQRLRIAYVPQRADIDWDFPVSVKDVVLMGRHGHLKFWQRPNAQDRHIAQQAIERVGLQGYEQHAINQLSGGQQQRVFIARALAQQADLYIMDEPFAGVDMATEKALMSLFDHLQHQGKTLVCVHHDLNTLREYFDYVLMINRQVIALGDMAQTFTLENLQATFEGRLPLLSEQQTRVG